MPHQVRERILVTSLLAISLLTPGNITNAAAVHSRGTASRMSRKFAANGPTKPVRLKPSQFLGAITVSFDLLPTSMSFDLPWHYCTVSENGIKFASFAAETYDPRNWNKTGAGASFEPGMDEEGRYVRAWVEHDSAARIVVRVQYALNNEAYDIAHSDLHTGSPYKGGCGDWGEEWYYIYPDGTYVRHMKIHTGLAAMSLPFGFNREPPMVVHEFMENIVIGPAGHNPEDDIEMNAVTLYKMYGKHTGTVYSNGIMQTFSFVPKYPDDYGDFRDANIMLINSKSLYKPFTIGLPYGVRIQPYLREDDEEGIFQTWRGYEEPSIGYITPLGHVLNYWHYRRNDTTLEQVYLHGVTNQTNPQKDLLKLAWSWIVAPELQKAGVKRDYLKFTYDPAQKAYIVPRRESGPEKIDFELMAIYDDAYLQGTMWLVNPVIIVKNWNKSNVGISLKVDGSTLAQGSDFRVGYEKTATGKDLVLWTNKTYDLSAANDNLIAVSIIPNSVGN
jgi:hypothetical protein